MVAVAYLEEQSLPQIWEPEEEAYLEEEVKLNNPPEVVSLVE